MKYLQIKCRSIIKCIAYFNSSMYNILNFNNTKVYKFLSSLRRANAIDLDGNSKISQPSKSAQNRNDSGAKNVTCVGSRWYDQSLNLASLSASSAMREVIMPIQPPGRRSLSLMPEISARGSKKCSKHSEETTKSNELSPPLPSSWDVGERASGKKKGS